MGERNFDNIPKEIRKDGLFPVTANQNQRIQPENNSVVVGGQDYFRHRRLPQPRPGGRGPR